MGLLSREMPTADSALPGRSEVMPVPETHFVNGAPLKAPFPENLQTAIFGLGCFWGAERRFWERQGVYTTAAGYAGGATPNPNYEEVCSGGTGHTEVVLVVYDPNIVSFQDLLTLFWESHDPTQGMRQGNDIGTQYRSVIYTSSEEQLADAIASKETFGESLQAAGYNSVTTEICSAPEFYYAEHYHQQYLARIPDSYCGLSGTGVCYEKGT
ncbi:MAG: peptide-methionine (S)-S-oxide reductase MsrA [Proteobacteria bacterium]|nr:peptide-methionine (S)-S-oxide reductase MsrA [Pseudomonadota bacterium]